jgi:hypothetical protein
LLGLHRTNDPGNIQSAHQAHRAERDLRALGNGVDIDIDGGEANQRLDAYQVLEVPTKIVSFEPVDLFAAPV